MAPAVEIEQGAVVSLVIESAGLHQRWCIRIVPYVGSHVIDKGIFRERTHIAAYVEEIAARSPLEPEIGYTPGTGSRLGSLRHTAIEIYPLADIICVRTFLPATQKKLPLRAAHGTRRIHPSRSCEIIKLIVGAPGTALVVAAHESEALGI